MGASKSLRFRQGLGKILFYLRIQRRTERIWVYVSLLAWISDLMITYSLLVHKAWTCWEAVNSTICNLDYGFEWPLDYQPSGITASIVFASCGQVLVTVGCLILGFSFLNIFCNRPDAYYVLRAVCLTLGTYLTGFSLMIHVIVQERIKLDFYKLITHYSVGLFIYLAGLALMTVAATVDLVGCVIPYALMNSTDYYILLWLHKSYLYHKARLLEEDYRVIANDIDINALEVVKK